MKRRLLVLAFCGALTAVAIAPTAGADPIQAKNSLQIEADCPGAAPYTVVVNGNGEFNAAHLLGSTSVFIPTAFNTTFTFTPVGGPTMTNIDTSAKAAPITNTITCTIPFQSFPSPVGTFTIEGTVTGFLTPR
ncbi:MAG: hypothetical protein E6G03_08095 [Actinobacteria bacterium]|nr:MAG: hypothetical protein E6G03_08095 [Actinomycetota bacterium]